MYFDIKVNYDVLSRDAIHIMPYNIILYDFWKYRIAKWNYKNINIFVKLWNLFSKCKNLLSLVFYKYHFKILF